jgi:hypothetical protein
VISKVVFGSDFAQAWLTQKRPIVFQRSLVGKGRNVPTTDLSIATQQLSLYKRQIGLLLNSELVDPAPDGMFPTAKEGTMAEAKRAPYLPDWMVEHTNRYLASGGTDGHM